MKKKYFYATTSTSKIYILLLLIYTPFYFAFSQGWTQLATTGAITARSNTSAIYDPVHNRMLLFGGHTSGGNVNDVWSLDLTSNVWSMIPTVSTQIPAPRFTHICMFDSLNNRMLVWSGNGSVLYNDVWAFNLSDSTWHQLFPDGNVTGAPLKRYGVAAVFDPLNRNIISFAGFTTSGRFDDTWSFSVDNQNWTDETNLIFPLRRCLTSQSFAPDRREMIVYGGQSTGNLNDLWTLNVDGFNWTNHTPAFPPAARHFPSNVYCGNGHVVIFGGNSLNQGNTAGALNDLWAFSLISQTCDTIPQGSIKPSARYGHTSIYIPSQDKMIIFGGQGVTSLNAETWQYTGISSVLSSTNEYPTNFNAFTCSPNPAHNFISVSFIAPTSGYEIEILNTFGEIIIKIKNQHRIDISQLSNGIYFIKVKQGERFYNKKFIKT